MSPRKNALTSVLAAVLACLATLVAPALAGAVTLPPGFEQTTAITGLTRPTDVELAPSGRVFIAEKSGIVKTYSSLADTTATTTADLRTSVHNFSGRGLMSLAVDPAFPTQPYIYVYYTLDATIGGTPPLYGSAGDTYDDCAKATGGLDENCIAAVRVSRLRLDGEKMTGSEQVLVEDYCHQFPYHTGGGLEFGSDGYLYVSGSDGSTARYWDYGQTGTPANPCGDPPGEVGSLLSPPTSEGGRLRSQDLRTAGDPTGLNGSLIRIDPATGAGVPGNPLYSSGASENERRMLGYGLRDSVRIAIRPGTSEVWVTDRGGGYWEEFNRVPAADGVMRNFGWPCYEGGLDANGVPYNRIRPRSNDLNLNICEDLYREGNAVVPPYWAYDHELPVAPGEACTTDAAGAPAGSLVSGVSFYPAAGGSFPASYRGALFFADRLRDCLYALMPGADGLPERGNVRLFATGAMRPFDIEIAPDGDLLYVDQEHYEVQRISFVGTPTNQAPTAVATASPVSGIAPLTVAFDGSGSSDPDAADALSYDWDLDGDGQFDDSTAARPSFTYTAPGAFTASLRVSDGNGGVEADTIAITVYDRVTTLRFTPEADARVEEGRQKSNFGSSNHLRVQGGTASDVESYLRFRVTGVNGPIQSVKLRLRALSDGTVDGPAVYPTGNLWTESTLKWANRPARGTEAIADTGPIAGNATVEYDVAPLVTGDGTFSVALATTSTDGVDLASREYSDAARRPVLEVTFGSPTDTEAPTAPVNLSAQAVSPTRVDLSWAAATDNVGVTGHEIYRNGELIATTGNVLTYSDTTAGAATSYDYTVKALDQSQNRSSASNVASITTPAAPTTLTFGPDADARVEEATPSTNFGNSTALRADAAGDPDVESYLRFQLAGITGQVQSAKLQLVSTTSTVDGPGVHQAGDSWSEPSINWFTRPPLVLGPVDDKGSIATGTVVEYDVKPLVSGNGTVTFALIGTSNDGVDFASRQHLDTTKQPRLVVTFAG